MARASTHDCDVLVVGTGPAGLVAALALAQAGLETVVVGPALDPARDTRTTALFAGSVVLLQNLGVRDRLGPAGVPMTGLRLIDDTGGLWRAPEVLFRASELGLDQFGLNIDNTTLSIALQAAASAQPGLHRLQGTVSSGFEWDEARVHLALDDGRRVSARLIVGADGRNSRCRQEAGIQVQMGAYAQTAVATRFAHTRAHEGISSEFHRAAGPLTTVPLNGQESSLIWVERPEEAERLMACDAPQFMRALEDRLQGLLGCVTRVGPRASFPLARMTAEHLAARRIALIGEAAHVIPPIGAQGLNLGLRDIAVLTELIMRARRVGADIGADAVLRSYEAERRGDIAMRTTMVDTLNRSLITDFLPLHLLRGAGLHALNSLPWLRNLVMREGLQPAGHTPALMRA